MPKQDVSKRTAKLMATSLCHWIEVRNEQASNEAFPSSLCQCLLPYRSPTSIVV